MEEVYRDRRNERSLTGVRTALIATPIVFLLFGLWDLWTDAASLPRTMPARAFFCGFWLLLWRTTFRPDLTRYLGWILAAAVIGSFMAIAWVLNIVPHGMVFGLMGFAYPEFALLLLPNMRIATFCNVMLLGIVNLWAVWLDTASPVLTNSNLLLFPLCCLTCLCVFANEVRDRRVFALEFELEGQATTDSLSGVFNRRHFMRCAQIELDRAGRYGHPTTLLMLDIDHFKIINDTYGHHVGDEAIKLLADTCRNTLRTTDCLGRIGGEEFAILLAETDLRPSGLVAERLRFLVSETPLQTGVPATPMHSFTVSIGVAAFEAGDSIELLMQRADAALYGAKNRGRNCVSVNEPLVAPPPPGDTRQTFSAQAEPLHSRI